MNWRESDHPRDGRGRFINQADWATIASDRVGGILGPQGEFDSEVVWRAFPSMLAPGLVPGDDPNNAAQHIERSQEEWGGLGRWWWLPEDAAPDLGFYGSKGSLLVGARLRSGETGLRERRGHSGHFAFEPADLAVVAVRVWEENGWRPIPVPPGLMATTHRRD